MELFYNGLVAVNADRRLRVALIPLRWAGNMTRSCPSCLRFVDWRENVTLLMSSPKNGFFYVSTQHGKLIMAEADPSSDWASRIDMARSAGALNDAKYWLKGQPGQFTHRVARCNTIGSR